MLDAAACEGSDTAAAGCAGVARCAGAGCRCTYRKLWRTSASSLRNLAISSFSCPSAPIPWLEGLGVPASCHPRGLPPRSVPAPTHLLVVAATVTRHAGATIGVFLSGRRLASLAHPCTTIIWQGQVHATRGARTLPRALPAWGDSIEPWPEGRWSRGRRLVEGKGLEPK